MGDWLVVYTTSVNGMQVLGDWLSLLDYGIGRMQKQRSAWLLGIGIVDFRCFFGVQTRWVRVDE